jgi:tRNA threonylcarbamoyl adenosine modification protein YeaZ
MKTLILENSTIHGSLVIADGDSVLWNAEFSKAGELASIVKRVISEAGSPNEIVVGIGPGSYTGLRVATATAIGLSLALGCPILGCPSVLGYEESSYTVVGDARRGSVFLAYIERHALLAEPELISLEQFHQLIPELRAQKLFAIGKIPGCEDWEVTVPRAEHLARRRSEFRTSFEPLYLKEPHITMRSETR